MGAYKNKAYPLRIDEEIKNKMKAISEIENRTLNKQIETVLRDYINNYEKNNGTINIKTINNSGNFENSGTINM